MAQRRAGHALGGFEGRECLTVAAEAVEHGALLQQFIGTEAAARPYAGAGMSEGVQRPEGLLVVPCPPQQHRPGEKKTRMTWKFVLGIVEQLACPGELAVRFLQAHPAQQRLRHIWRQRRRLDIELPRRLHLALAF